MKKRILSFYRKAVETVRLKIKEWLDKIEMNKIRRVERSRDVWRIKASERAEANRELRKEKKKNKLKNNVFREEHKILKEKYDLLLEEVKKKRSLKSS